MSATSSTKSELRETITFDVTFDYTNTDILMSIYINTAKLKSKKSCLFKKVQIDVMLNFWAKNQFDNFTRSYEAIRQINTNYIIFIILSNYFGK